MSKATEYPTATDDDQDLWDALKQLAPRRLVDPASDDALVQWEVESADRYRVTRAGRTIGFIDVVGAVFVALHGSRYARAVEADQTLLFTHAIQSLIEADQEDSGRPGPA